MEPETLSFSYKGHDDLDNPGATILAANQFQVYQGDLPPLSTPAGLKATALPGGAVKLEWQPVEEASDYQLYRRSNGESQLQPVARTSAATGFEDTPPAEDLWIYAVASVRTVDGEESISGPSVEVSVHTDATAPNPPQNLTLELTPQGIKLDWDAPVGGEAVTYGLYRSSETEIVTVENLQPLVTGINQTMVIDPTPSPTEHSYAITAIDGIGNESPPSNSAYHNVQLLPVSELKVSQQGIDYPTLSWKHPKAANMAGYSLTISDRQNDATVTSTKMVTGLSYTDTGASGDERFYALSAVDENGFESLPRSIMLPTLRSELLPDSVIERNVMNKLTYRVKNHGRTTLSDISLAMELDGRHHISEKFDLPRRRDDTHPADRRRLRYASGNGDGTSQRPAHSQSG
jgi:large repetitive protein